MVGGDGGRQAQQAALRGRGDDQAPVVALVLVAVLEGGQYLAQPAPFSKDPKRAAFPLVFIFPDSITILIDRMMMVIVVKVITT